MTKLPSQYKWLTTEKLVVKPDQLIKRRGKNNLILVDANYDQAKAWIEEKSKAPITIYGKFDANGKPVGQRNSWATNALHHRANDTSQRFGRMLPCHNLN